MEPAESPRVEVSLDVRSDRGGARVAGLVGTPRGFSGIFDERGFSSGVRKNLTSELSNVRSMVSSGSCLMDLS